MDRTIFRILAVVSRVGLQSLQSLRIQPEARRDPQTISLVKVSPRTAQRKQEQPEAFHQERHRSNEEYAPREAFHRERDPRLLLLQSLLRMIRIFKTSILLFREMRKSFREEPQRSLR